MSFSADESYMDGRSVLDVDRSVLLANDDEFGRVMRETDAATESMDVKLLHKALRNAHVSMGKLRRERQDLVQQFVQLQRYVVILAATNRTKRKRGKKADDDDSDDEDDDDMIPTDLMKLAVAIREGSKKAAHLFVMFWNYSTPSCLTGNSKLSFEWDDVDRRYETPESGRRALTAELFKCVPPKFHDYIRSNRDPFCKLFYGWASKHRSNTANRLRTNAAAIFGPFFIQAFDAKRGELIAAGKWSSLDEEEQKKYIFGPHVFTKDFEREKCDILLAALGYDPTKVVTEATKGLAYTKWPSIIYEGYKYQPGKEFMNELLVRMGRVWVFGASAVEGDRGKCRIRKTNPIAGEELAATVGFIANCATLLMWMISGDTELNNDGVGNVTGIDYPGNTNSYKRCILSLDPASMQKLFDYWNKRVFPNHAGGDLQDSAANRARSSTTNASALVEEDDAAHIARVREALANARISSPAPETPGPSPPTRRNEQQPRRSTQSQPFVPGQDNSDVPPAVSALPRGQRAGSAPADPELSFDEHDLANSTFFPPNFLSLPAQSTPALHRHNPQQPLRQTGTADRSQSVFASDARRLNSDPRTPSLGPMGTESWDAEPLISGRNPSVHSESTTASGAAGSGVNRSGGIDRTRDVEGAGGLTTPLSLEELRVPDLKDWCSQANIRSAGTKKADFIAAIKSAGKYPTPAAFNAYKTAAQMAKQRKAGK